MGTPIAERGAVTNASPPRELRRVAVSSLLGSSMEWYDYFLYGIFSALVFNKVFFPSLDPTTGTIAAFLTFAVGFISRPLGAVLFGHVGDRFGRKVALVTTLTVIGLATGLIGLLPGYASIGIWAPVLLATLRFIQGLSAGGEWGGAILMSLEHAPPSQRAFYGSLPQLGSPIATLASSGIVALVTLLPNEHLITWGWRIPFLLAFPLLGIAIYLRLRVEESPLFVRVQKEAREIKVPIAAAFRHGWGRILIGVCAAIFGSGAFFLMTSYAVNYGTTTLKLPASLLLAATIGGAILEGIAIVVSGRLADRYAPWRVTAVGAAICVGAAVPVAALIGTGSPLAVVTGIAIGIGVLGLPYGPLGAVLAQMFDEEVRYTAVAVSYSLATTIGGFVPSIALAMKSAMEGSVWVIAILMAGICMIALCASIAAGSALSRTRTAQETANSAH